MGPPDFWQISSVGREINVMIKLRWPLLGIVIPSVLIALIAYGSHYFVFAQHMAKDEQIRFQIYVTMVWLSYLLAIKVLPGTPPAGFEPAPGQWRRWCKKCNNYKPERTHHCKTCNTCVLKMDHHCPWTYNCVGHGNLPHFLRFLGWVVFTTGIVLVELSKQAIRYYNDSDLPTYLISKSEMVAVIFLLPVDFFVFLTVALLLIRCLLNLNSGQTQIEVWEMERIESQFHTERMWLRIRRNYEALYGRAFPHLTSWNESAVFHHQREEIELEDSVRHEDDIQEIVPATFTTDDLVFPYDLGTWSNAVDALGYPWNWPLPWGGSSQSGYQPTKSADLEDDQLGLPWPPDGGHQEDEPEESSETASPHVRRRKDPRQDLGRTEWMNDYGETLDDFGVDIDAEDHELLVKKSN